MSAPLSLSESQTLTALRSFLLSVLPAGIEVIRGQDNRVSEPDGDDFVVMTPMLRTRLETNVAAYDDVSYTGSIAGSVMTVTGVSFGTIAVGDPVFGVGVTAGTVVKAVVSGSGGVGTYTVSPSQTIASQVLSSGTRSVLQPVQVTVQIDIHGPASPDNAQIITTLLRDEYATDLFASSGFDVTPLYANDPRQMPFTNGEQQVENRWVVDAVLQCNPILTVPQQFADELVATTKAPL
jgi:hypothetical protein